MNRDHVTLQVNENLKSDIPANIYEILCELARSALRRTARNATLDTSAVVHDAMLKVWDKDKPHFATRGHFYALMLKIMRDTVIDHARRKMAQKHGGDQQQISLTLADRDGENTHIDLHDWLQLDQAMQQLHQLDATLGDMITMRFYGGLQLEEMAEHFECSSSSIKRHIRDVHYSLKASLH